MSSACLSWLAARGRPIWAVALILGALAASPTLRAQNNAPPADQSDPWGNNGARRAHSDPGAGYDPHAGAAKRAVPDLAVAGSVGAFPLAWTRRWNSARTPESVVDLPVSFAAGGWDHSYSWMAIFDQSAYEPPEHGGAGTQPPTNPYRSFIHVRHPDGATTSFHHDSPTADPSTSGTQWAGSVGVSARIEVRDAQASEFWLHQADGSTVKFQACGASAFSTWCAFEIVAPHGLPSASRRGGRTRTAATPTSNTPLGR